MVKIENIETHGWERAIYGMRLPMNSHNKSDSFYWQSGNYHVGSNDLDLACRLIKAGAEHRKFLRMIHVQMDITAPTFFWNQLDTYKIATTRNSSSKMHKIHAMPFTASDFSHEGCCEIPYTKDFFEEVVITCERLRIDYNRTKDKKYWRALIELLPEGYNMKATWDGSMETILNVTNQREGHKLDEWEDFRQLMFDNIPYYEDFYEAMNKKGE